MSETFVEAEPYRYINWLETFMRDMPHDAPVVALDSSYNAALDKGVFVVAQHHFKIDEGSRMDAHRIMVPVGVEYHGNYQSLGNNNLYFEYGLHDCQEWWHLGSSIPIYRMSKDFLAVGGVYEWLESNK